MSKLGSLVVATWVALSLSSAALAYAQPDVDERARVHFNSGRAYFDSGEYPRALQEFQAAYDLSQREELHYNLFLCHERIGNTADAIRELEAFLATNPPTRPQLEPRLHALRERQEREAAAADAERREREAIERRAAEAEAQAREAEARARDAHVGTAEREDEGARVHPGALVGYGVGAAGLATFAVAGILVVTHDGDFSRGCLPAGTCSRSDLDRQDRRALIADIGLGVGIAGAVTGLVIHLVTRPSNEADEDGPTARVTPVLAPGLAGAAVVGSF